MTNSYPDRSPSKLHANTLHQEYIRTTFELLFDQELLAAGWDLTTRETKLAKTEARPKLNPRLDRFSTAEACNIAMGIFSSLC